MNKILNNCRIQILFIAISAISNNIFSQKNLIYNGSFEEYYRCPCKLNNVDTIPCIGWWSPNDATPDCFNKCWIELIDSNFCWDDYIYLASYKPKTGNGYIGLALIGVENFWMEHIQSKLIEPLEAGKQYKVSFWVKLAYKYSDYAVYNIGLYFSKDSDIVGKKNNVSNYVRYITPELRAHIKNQDGNFITDTNWVEISGIYTAQGGEQYVTIGMFWDDTPAVVEAHKKYKNKNTQYNKKLLSKAIKNNLLVENPYIEKYKKMEDQYIRSHSPYYYHYWDKEKKNVYYLIDDVSVIELDE
ncbi:MAG TPA: carbohydrate binding domain-containing protein [Bacteroidales bacterium]|jgi:hypothetical protein|nr:carbohydrate binding domain-containing protein [Bacteroidales bacterium]HQC59358.1 carbohydrate binding domain-containing protein [Bacteroidales bacterium]